MDSIPESTRLVATVFSTKHHDDPFQPFREFLHTHMVSFTSAHILKSASAKDPLVVTEYLFLFESNTSADLSALRKSAYEWSKSVGVDVAIQHDDVFRKYRRLVVFDMDSTLIKQEVIDEIALYLDSINPEKNVGVKVAVLTHDICGTDRRKSRSWRCWDRLTLKSRYVGEYLYFPGRRRQYMKRSERNWFFKMELGYYAPD